MTDYQAPPDARLQRLMARLSRQTWAKRDPEPPEGHAQAAISVVLRTTDELEVLLIKRAESERDLWSGHMALPGGRWDVTDSDLADTAIRETAEETGVELRSRGWHLGRLEEVSPTRNRLPRLTVVPYVFGVPRQIAASVNSPEIDSVMWVELSTLRNPDTRGTTTIDLPEGRRTFPCFQIGGHVVWGLTFRILTGLLQVFEES